MLLLSGTFWPIIYIFNAGIFFDREKKEPTYFVPKLFHQFETMGCIVAIETWGPKSNFGGTIGTKV